MSSDPEAPTSASSSSARAPRSDTLDPTDPLEPLRAADRTARTVAGAVLAGTLLGTAAAATVPLWSEQEHLRTILAASDVRESVTWAWDLSPHDAWWAFGLVLLGPCLAVVVGAVVARRRLAGAAAAAPFQACGDETRAQTAAPARPGHLSAAQRRARERGRRDEILVAQRHVVAGTRRRVSVWTTLGGGAALVVGAWFAVALSISALGGQQTALGIWLTAASWWVVVVPYALGCLVAGLRRGWTRRRSDADRANVPEPGNAPGRGPGHPPP